MSQTDLQKNSLSPAMRACVENGQRLHRDAECLAEYLAPDRSATIIALCILAQEEFAKAFLLHLINEGHILWTPKIRESLHNHKHKQLLGIIMDWLSPSYEEWAARVKMGVEIREIPSHVSDAIKLYVEKVQPQGYFSCHPGASDQIAQSVADGDRDKTKQDALYVRLSETGTVVGIPTQVSPEIIQAELDKTKQIGDLVSPLRKGDLGPVLDYQLFLDALNFHLLDKRGRPFLILKESQFAGTVVASNGTTWPHSITMLVENISDEQATISGYATLFLDKEVLRPFFNFVQFTIDPHAANLCAFFLSEDAYISGTSPSHTLELSVNLDYHGINTGIKYHAHIWSKYIPTVRRWVERFTDSKD